MAYKELIGMTLIASGVLGSGVFAQDVSESSDINYENDYEQIAVYQTTDEELLNKVKRYVNSKKKEARILKAENDQDIKAIMKRARNAGTEEAKQAVRIAIKDQKNQLKRELYSIRSDIKQVIKRARNAAQNS